MKKKTKRFFDSLNATIFHKNLSGLSKNEKRVMDTKKRTGRNKDFNYQKNRHHVSMGY